MKLEITPVNNELRKALDSISKYDVKSYQRLEKALERGVKSIEGGAKRRVPCRSGKLKKSISSKTSRTVLEGYVRARAPHANLIEYGVKEHEVDLSKPGTLSKKRVRKGTKAMNVSAAGGGGTGWATKIKIPARPKQPFMQPAFEESRPKIVKSFEDAVQP